MKISGQSFLFFAVNLPAKEIFNSRVFAHSIGWFIGDLFLRRCSRHGFMNFTGRDL
jgi:hypothetical protein